MQLIIAQGSVDVISKHCFATGTEQFTRLWRKVNIVLRFGNFQLYQQDTTERLQAVKPAIT
jgi:hypothetical protein